MDSSLAPDSPQRQQRPLGALLVGVAVAGGVGWLVDTALLWVLDTRLGVPTAIAAAIGFVASGIVNFLINRVVFDAGGHSRGAQTAKYAALFALNLVVVTAAVPLLSSALDGVVHAEGLRLVAAKIVVTAVMLLPNTFAYRHWVFTGTDRPTPDPDSPGRDRGTNRTNG